LLRTGPQQDRPFGPVTVAKAYRLLRGMPERRQVHAVLHRRVIGHMYPVGFCSGFGFDTRPR
jgi:hypothetical protein